MRLLALPLALICCALVAASCSNTPTTAATTNNGKTTLDSFLSNASYSAWYQTGYGAYPDAALAQQFDSNVAVIRAAFNPAEDTMLMVIKPNCGCQDTQREMPAVLKTLDMAGIPHSNLLIYITDGRLAGIDAIRTRCNITDAPTFLLLRNGVEAGRIVKAPELGHTVDGDLAAYFTK